MSWLRKKHQINVDVRKRGFTFAKCTMCESLKDLISKVGKNNVNGKEAQMKLKRHNKHQESYKTLYRSWKIEYIWSKEKFLCVIHDKMDHSTIAILRLEVKNKMMARFNQLPITLTGMIIHGHGDEAYAQY
jgi:hypothetical protein